MYDYHPYDRTAELSTRLAMREAALKQANEQVEVLTKMLVGLCDRLDRHVTTFCYTTSNEVLKAMFEDESLSAWWTEFKEAERKKAEEEERRVREERERKRHEWERELAGHEKRSAWLREQLGRQYE